MNASQALLHPWFKLHDDRMVRNQATGQSSKDVMAMQNKVMRSYQMQKSLKKQTSVK